MPQYNRTVKSLEFQKLVSKGMKMLRNGWVDFD